ncbi:hypothetical protein DPMN_038294 [Dreissena polymorpha]|uniref:Uncharacterized protein n=1 Tax=Dreissena polymorpha TaxID=45954 RepID=A0A9D4MF55_DREPO|nr:hypothetical protein DPMN_038294 [Dreissena polymorpha]
MASPDPDVYFNVPSDIKTVDELRSDASSNSAHVHDAQSRRRSYDAPRVSLMNAHSPAMRRSSFDRTNNNPHDSRSTSFNHGDTSYTHFIPPPPPMHHTLMKPDMYDGNSSHERIVRISRTVRNYLVGTIAQKY